MSNPRVSIVIVNWKTPRLLAGCLDSIFAEPDARSFEVWVIDNASGDESVSLVREDYPAVRLIANDENIGFSRACNQAIPLCTGKFILLLNPDTVVIDSCI